MSIDIVLENLLLKDSGTVSAFIESHTTSLFKLALRLNFNKEEAEDIVQNTWITFFEILPKFEKRSSLKTFLFGVFYNKTMEYKKKNFRLKDSVNFEEHFDSLFDQTGHFIKKPVDPEAYSQSSQLNLIIEKCLEFLPLKQKLAFTLKEVDEEETEEICKTLDITTSNLGVLLFRAKNQLRACIESKVV